MLIHLDIRDFAIVEHVELELGVGMTVLTGETGAGKSILVDALNLVLGDRADSDAVRAGAERAEIIAQFDIAGLAPVQEWLAERDLALPEQECMVRRTVTREGRSRAYINGHPSPLQDLRALGEMLVDIHGQHAHQSLLRRDAQRQILDGYAGNRELLAELGLVYRQWQGTQREIAALGGNREQRQGQLDLLRYQVGELRALDLGERELAELDAEHARLGNAGRLLEGAQRTLAALFDDEQGAAIARMESARRDIAGLQEFDQVLGPIGELIEGAIIQAREAAADLRHYLDKVDLDPERLAWVEQRLGEVHQLARKHRVNPGDLPGLLERLAAELEDLEGGDQRLEKLEATLDRVRSNYEDLAARLHRRRLAAAETFAAAIGTNMGALGMPGGTFRIQVESAPGDSAAVHGRDRVEFLVSANPGQPLHPLAKVASGGEISRISLAIQVVGAGDSGVASLVFDEVDVGIGGRVAEIVGQQLRALGRTRQVLCITHLPQVACQGTGHLRVSKENDAQSTSARVDELDHADRVEEVARMLGGVEITTQTLAHAREMIERAGG